MVKCNNSKDIYLKKKKVSTNIGLATSVQEYKLSESTKESKSLSQLDQKTKSNQDRKSVV